LPNLEEFLEDLGRMAAVKTRLQEIYAVVDALTRANLSFSETFFWTGFLIPFLEIALGVPFQEIQPEVIEQYVNNSLEILEFARGKREEVILLWLTAIQLQRLLKSGKNIPARLKRRGCLPEAWLLHHILLQAPAELFAEIAAQGSIMPNLPDVPAPKKRRRSRNSRSRKKVFPV
jgi:hypothetical protein